MIALTKLTVCMPIQKTTAKLTTRVITASSRVITSAQKVCVIGTFVTINTLYDSFVMVVRLIRWFISLVVTVFDEVQQTCNWPGAVDPPCGTKGQATTSATG